METNPDTLAFLEAFEAREKERGSAGAVGVKDILSEKIRKVLAAKIVSVVWEGDYLLLLAEMPERQKFRRMRRYPEATRGIFGAVASVIMDVPNAEDDEIDHAVFTVEEVKNISFPAEGQIKIRFRVAEHNDRRDGWCACDGEAKFSYTFHDEEAETEADYGGEGF